METGGVERLGRFGGSLDSLEGVWTAMGMMETP